MSEETTTPKPNETPPSETEPESQEIIPWPTTDDSLTDAAIGFGLGALATVAIICIAGIFRR
jgi:translation elongation factor EF-1beta